MKLTHDLIERNQALLVVLVILVIAVGGLVEIVPLAFQKSVTEPVAGLQVIEQGLHGDARAREHGRAAEDPRIAVHDRGAGHEPSVRRKLARHRGADLE